MMRIALCLVALAACGGSPRQPPTTQGQAMIHFVRDLAQYVTHRARTVEELTSRLGTVKPEGDDDAVWVAPTDPRLTEVRIAKSPDGSPSTIRLGLAQGLPLADLKSAFGAYQTHERSDPDLPWPLLFNDAVRGGVASVSLLVEAPGPLAQLDRQDVSSVTLRIDRR